MVLNIGGFTKYVFAYNDPFISQMTHINMFLYFIDTIDLFFIFYDIGEFVARNKHV